MRPPPARVLLPGDARPSRMRGSSGVSSRQVQVPSISASDAPCGWSLLPVPERPGPQVPHSAAGGHRSPQVSCHGHSMGSDTLWHVWPLSWAVPTCVLCPLCPLCWPCRCLARPSSRRVSRADPAGPAQASQHAGAWGGGGGHRGTFPTGQLIPEEQRVRPQV